MLPPRIFSQAERAWHVMDNIRCKDNNLAKYLYLVGLQDRNEKLFYRVLIDNMAELSPIVYTPTVGLACQEYSRIFRRPRGIFISKYDRNHVEEGLRNWPHREVRVIVVTDGERILGLGDLGANGMGIPIGKLSLYTACAGIDPGPCLPVMIDVGTNNPKVSGDPCYIGLPEPRLRGEEYDALIDEFMAAVAETFPRAMIQFEDFGNLNAFRLLERYRDRYRTFNDDIQGTAAMTLAGLYSALRMIGGRLDEQRIVILGAGSAALGIGKPDRLRDDRGGPLGKRSRPPLLVSRFQGAGRHRPDRPLRTEAPFRPGRTSLSGSPLGRRSGQTDGDHRRIGPAGHLHAGGTRCDGPDQPAPDRPCAFESDLPVGMHGRRGLSVHRRAGRLRERQPVPGGCDGRPDLCAGSGEQQLHLSRRRAGHPGHRGVTRDG